MTGQHPVAQPPILHQSSQKPNPKKLTNKSSPCMGVEYRDAAQKIVIHGNIHGGLSPAHLRLSSTQRGRRPSLLHGHGREQLAGAEGSGLRAQRRLAGARGGILRDPRAMLTSRRGSPTLENARCFHDASWRSFSITADTTAAKIPPVRKNLHLMS
jgi:hypothetical protein